MANPLAVTLIIGKEGVTDAVERELDALLESHELVKGKVLESAMLTPRTVSEALCEGTGADAVQCLSLIHISLAGGAFKDYKTMLQEIVQKNKQETLEYRLAGQSGPDHDKRFKMELLLNSNVFAEGIGKSKKEAEQMAAKKALENMGC